MKKILIIIAVLLFLQASAQGYRSCEDKQLLVSKLSHICKYPIKLQASNQEAIVAIEYKTDNKGNSYIMILFLVAKITRRLLLKYMTLELLQKSKMYSLERCS